MNLISDNYHSKKLSDNKINIKTMYIVGNNILERNTDNSHNDDIEKGIRCKKEYYVDKKLVHFENIFDSRIEYTFISKDLENKEYKCPNCSMISKLKDINEGCPYCNTYYNVDYTDKDLGSKYHYDLVLKSNKYKIVTLIVDVICSFILSLLYILITSRTFNLYDISKVFIYGFILAAILYYLFYMLDAYVILGPIKRYKERENQKQKDFWNRTNLDKKDFFNNLNYEVRKYFYKKDNIIDYDMLDFNSFRDYKIKDELYVDIEADIRIVEFNNRKIKSTFKKEIFTMKKVTDNTLELKDGVNVIKCTNCGASIKAEDKICSYCKSEIKYLQKWVLINK